MMEAAIPKAWSVSGLLELGEWSGGGTPSKAIEEYWNGDIPWVSPKDMKHNAIFDSEDHISESAINNSAAKLIDPNSILFVTRSGILAHTFPVSINMVKVAVNQDIKALTPYNGIDAQYLAWLLRERARQVLETCSKDGTTVNSIETARLHALSVPIAPSREQRRIVAKIEELFSELDNGVEYLKTAQTLLKVYRQALLKHAFEGKLTAQWRADNPDKLETGDALLKRIQKEREHRYQQKLSVWEASGKQGSKPKVPTLLLPLGAKELAELPEQPEMWGRVTIDWLLSLNRKPMATGPFGTLLSKSDHKSSGLPVLGIENIGNGLFVRGNKIFVSQEKSKQLEPFKVEAGDVVISRSGTVGEICKIPNGIGTAYISTNLIRVSLNCAVISPDFFVLLFQGGGAVKQQVKNLCKGSSRDFLNQSILSAIAFPLPCLREQEQIVVMLSEKLSEAEQLDQTLAATLQQSEALRQSILKKAFSGQLVPQDPTDEPTSALLARIKAEKSAQPTSKKARK